MSAYDQAAPAFDLHRRLPAGAPEAIRSAILEFAALNPRPRVLDLGAGTGRIGRAFVAAGDAYHGVDFSLGMLREFRGRSPGAALAQADGERLPFAGGAFDIVMLIQVLGGARGWRRLLDEGRRVLRSGGALAIGQSAGPANGVDARMRIRLAEILAGLGMEPYHKLEPYHKKAGTEALSSLESVARRRTDVPAAAWISNRTPRAFLERQPTGARFSALPAPAQAQALRQLGAWAETAFGSLDASFDEEHIFQFHVFEF